MDSPTLDPDGATERESGFGEPTLCSASGTELPIHDVRSSVAFRSKADSPRLPFHERLRPHWALRKSCAPQLSRSDNCLKIRIRNQGFRSVWFRTITIS